MDAAIIGIGGAILGALTGAWITYWFLIKIDKRQVRQWDVVPLIPFLI
jgi:ABC-type lipoprotein release transport system permease subunit